MASWRPRLLAALSLAAALVLGATAAAPAQAATQDDPPVTMAYPSEDMSVSCTQERELGTKKVLRDKGMDAMTVRQYIGWCRDSRGWAWMNYTEAYVWAQYANLGFGYQAQVGVLVSGQNEVAGYVSGANRARTTWSTPVRTTAHCTQGWAKLQRTGGESAQALTSKVC